MGFFDLFFNLDLQNPGYFFSKNGAISDINAENQLAPSLH